MAAFLLISSKINQTAPLLTKHKHNYFGHPPQACFARKARVEEQKSGFEINWSVFSPNRLIPIDCSEGRVTWRCSFACPPPSFPMGKPTSGSRRPSIPSPLGRTEITPKKAKEPRTVGNCLEEAHGRSGLKLANCFIKSRGFIHPSGACGGCPSSSTGSESAKRRQTLAPSWVLGPWGLRRGSRPGASGFSAGAAPGERNGMARSAGALKRGGAIPRGACKGPFDDLGLLTCHSPLGASLVRKSSMFQ